MSEVDKDLATIKQAAQKLAYAKELVTEATTQVCQISQPKSQIATEPILVTIHAQDNQKDDIFILAYQVAKLLKNEWGFVEATLKRIEEAQLEKLKEPTKPNQTHESKKSFSVIAPDPEV